MQIQLTYLALIKTIQLTYLAHLVTKWIVQLASYYSGLIFDSWYVATAQIS